jgi:hypothetical protein
MRRTVHKVRAVYQETSLGVVVTQDSVIYKRPAKCICDKDNDAFGRDAGIGFGNICLNAMDCDFLASGMALGDASTKAVGTGHCKGE